MSVYYQDEYVTLYHGNSLTEHTEWVTADLLLTDPPYGRNWRQGDLHGDKRDGIAGDKDTTTRDRALTMWGANRTAIVFGDPMLPPPPGNKLTAVYAKPVDAGIRGAIGGVRRDTEAIYLIGRWSSGIGGRSSIFRTRAAQTGGHVGVAARAGGHPHTKPLDLLAELISLMCDGSIADPFAGSGSILVAAKQSGRRAVGVELDERWCEIAARRLAQDVLPFGEAS